MLLGLIAFKVLLLFYQALKSEGFEIVNTEQEASALRPSTLLVQLLTEPQSLIRLFDGLNLSFQMLRHYGTTGSALLSLPFNRDILTGDYDHIGLDLWKRPYYARMPTRFPAEAPRYVRMPDHRRSDTMSGISSTADNPLLFYLRVPHQY